MTSGVDYAWFSTSIKRLADAIKNSGKEFVCRYLSHDAGKSLSRDEAQALTDDGLWIVVVWETTATRASDGFAAGASDAHEALRQAELCGMPAGGTIYFAVDYDANPADILPYFQGVNHVLPASQAGVYGGYAVVKALLDAGLVTKAWQADAWSYGRWDGRDVIHQGAQWWVAGVDTDIDTAEAKDYGQWQIGHLPDTTNQQGGELPFQFGQLNYGHLGANTPISIPKGLMKSIGFAADNGLVARSGVKLRVAQRIGLNNWKVDPVTVDSTQEKTTLPLDPNADEISVTYEDDGLVPVAWDAH